jgi:hypothetical protein
LVADFYLIQDLELKPVAAKSNQNMMEQRYLAPQGHGAGS